MVVWVRNCSTDIFLVKLLHSVRFVTLCGILTSQQEVETVCQLISRNANRFNHRFLCFCFVLDCILAFLLLFRPNLMVSRFLGSSLRSLALNCILRRGAGGDRDPRRWGLEGTAFPNAILSPPENVSRIMVGSHVSHFNVSFRVSGKVAKTASTDHSF